MRMFQALIFGAVLIVTPAIASAGYVVVKMDKTKPNGKPWDVWGGAPDPYVIVNGNSYRSKMCKNSYTCTIQISETGTITVEALDADVAFDDSAGKCRLKPNSHCDTGKGAKIAYISGKANFDRAGNDGWFVTVMVAVLRWFGAWILPA